MELQSDKKEFIETAKIDVFGDKLHCYTPKGDAKELPEGSTILDFAYSVHEEVGNRSVGAKVNGKFVPLRHKLVKGDVVEIVTNKKQRPRRSWLKIVKSGGARQKIREACKYRLKSLGENRTNINRVKNLGEEKYSEASDILHGKLPGKTEGETLDFLKDVFSVIEALYSNR